MAEDKTTRFRWATKREKREKGWRMVLDLTDTTKDDAVFALLAEMVRKPPKGKTQTVLMWDTVWLMKKYK